MYIPSPLPTTRLSVSTSALPSSPSPAPKAPTFLSPLKNAKGKYTGKLGGVLEEEGEEIIAIASAHNDELAPNGGLWAVLGREEVTVWCIRVSFNLDAFWMEFIPLF